MSTVQIVHGGSDKKNGDYSRIHKFAKNKMTSSWGCGKQTKAGDRLLIYFEQPHSSIVATAVASKDAVPGESRPYVTRIGQIQLLRVPISLSEMQEMFPRWKWLNYPRAKQYLDKTKAAALLKRVSLRIKTPPVAVRVSGAGFGKPEQNRLVERAACRAAKKYYEQRGYGVISREKENVGYDFEVTKGGETLHVEIKGVSGSALRFPITANEVDCAHSDSSFRLAVVTEALRAKRRVHIFTRQEFLEEFGLKPIAYIAEPKRSTSYGSCA